MSVQSRLATGIAGPFSQEARPVATPAVASGLTITVPGGEVWKVRTVKARLVTDANVANRTLALTVGNQAVTIGTFAAQATIAASLTTDVTWMAGAVPTPTAIVAGAILAPLPELVLVAGWQLAITIGAVQAADQLSQVVAYIDRLDQPPYVLPLFGTPEADRFREALAAEYGG